MSRSITHNFFNSEYSQSFSSLPKQRKQHNVLSYSSGVRSPKNQGVDRSVFLLEAPGTFQLPAASAFRGSWSLPPSLKPESPFPALPCFPLHLLFFLWYSCLPFIKTLVMTLAPRRGLILYPTLGKVTIMTPESLIDLVYSHKLIFQMKHFWKVQQQYKKKVHMIKIWLDCIHLKLNVLLFLPQKQKIELITSINWRHFIITGSCRAHLLFDSVLYSPLCPHLPSSGRDDYLNVYPCVYMSFLKSILFLCGCGCVLNVSNVATDLTWFLILSTQTYIFSSILLLSIYLIV